MTQTKDENDLKLTIIIVIKVHSTGLVLPYAFHSSYAGFILLRNKPYNMNINKSTCCTKYKQKRKKLFFFSFVWRDHDKGKGIPTRVTPRDDRYASTRPKRGSL